MVGSRSLSAAKRLGSGLPSRCGPLLGGRPALEQAQNPAPAHLADCEQLGWLSRERLHRSRRYRSQGLSPGLGGSSRVPKVHDYVSPISVIDVETADETGLLFVDLTKVVEVYGAGALELVNAPLKALAARTEVSGETVFFYTQDSKALMNALTEYPNLRTLHRPANLEDLFLKLTGRQIREDA